jgi:hypothetical protein
MRRALFVHILAADTHIMEFRPPGGTCSKAGNQAERFPGAGKAEHLVVTYLSGALLNI